MKKRFKVLLTGSLLVNVLLIGFVGGHMYRKWANHPWQEVKQELAPQTRNVVGRTFQSAFRDIRPLGDEARKERASLVKILSAEEFDEAAFDEAVENLTGLSEQMMALKIKATKEVAGELSADERRKMADRMAKMIGGGKERHVKRDRKPDMIKRHRDSKEQSPEE